LKPRHERRIRKRQVLRICDLELDMKAVGFGAPARARQQRFDVIRAGHLAPAPRGRQRHIAVAGSNVEHGLAGAQIHAFDETLADNLQGRADNGIVARRPRRMLFGLQGLQIRCRRFVRGQGTFNDGGHDDPLQDSSVATCGAGPASERTSLAR
jgi:hypothetical protein